MRSVFKCMKNMATQAALTMASMINIHIFRLPEVASATQTSIPVRVPSTKKTAMYSFLLICPDNNLSSRSQEIDESEYQYPDEIYKVPEEAGDLDVIDVSLVVSPFLRSQHDYEQVNDAGEHVETMKPGDEKKG